MITIDNVLIEVKVDRLLVSSSSESIDHILAEMQEMPRQAEAPDRHRRRDHL